MVNQLLTEMDGFHREELVFVVGTTNFVEILDAALCGRGRFEFHLHIPYPDAEDRREILASTTRRWPLHMTDETLDYAVKRTADYVEGAALGTRYSGDHLNAMCRALARIRLRENIQQPAQPADIDRTLTEWLERPQMTPHEEKVVATHEAGHAVFALFSPHATPIERISIQADTAGASALFVIRTRHTSTWSRAANCSTICASSWVDARPSSSFWKTCPLDRAKTCGGRPASPVP